jgi:predicted nucleic-acid-binding Zn-ribbon protein
VARVTDGFSPSFEKYTPISKSKRDEVVEKYEVLKKYDEKSQCFKCGGYEVGTKYCIAENHYISSFNKVVNPERMERTCLRCGFAWYEAPLNLKNNENES